MASLAFHHGTSVTESGEAPVLIRTSRTNVMAIIGTAPDADASKFPYDTPVLVKGGTELSTAAELGDAGTLKAALDAVFDHIGAYVYIIRVEEGVDYDATLANIVGDFATLTGVHALKKCESLYGRHMKPRIVCAPGFTHISATDGIASVNVTVAGSGYTNPIVTIDGDGAGAEATATLVDGAIDEIYITKPGYGYTAATVTITDDDGADATATAVVGATANPVVGELYGILEELRAVAFVDGPDTTDAAAVTYASLIESQRVMVVDPKALVYDTSLQANVPQFSSARFAAVQARTDQNKGFWWSLSNQPINGIVGINRPIRYHETTNYLNEAKVSTITNERGGFRTWGNRAATSNSLWTFLNVRRTADFINEAIEDAFMEFVDRPITLANIKFIVESGNAFIRELVAERAILGGEVWFDPEKNTDATMANGRVVFGVKFEPPAPMEHIDIRAHRAIEYYAELRDSVLRELAQGSLQIAA